MKNPEVKRKGPKGKYHDWITEEGLVKIQGWARMGLTDEQIATNIGITRSTLCKWKNEFSQISDALKKGKEVVNFEVENALIKRALGFEYEEITTETKISDGGCEVVHVKKVKKMVAPDTGACAFYLKNKMSDQWSDNPRNGQDKNNFAKEWAEAVIGAEIG
ncbi:helix-turn-helix domain-containing protein [Eubacterium sp.]|uniref:helix-turn-helix domain-containing protein n=1 Tax=Eubacterium sp. TaxID=142586 RepID=UPI002FCB978C